MRAKIGRVALAAVLLAAGCSSRKEQGTERLALLPFENLSSDPALDWMGRGLAEQLRGQLSGTPRIEPEFVPSLRDLPASGADRVLQGYYWVVGGRLRVQAVVAETRTSRTVRSLSAEGPASRGMTPLAASIARQLDAQARPPATESEAAWRALVSALEARDPATADREFERAVAADASFGAAYLGWAQSLAERGDRARALEVIGRAGARAPRLPALERARLDLLASALSNDRAGRRRALLEVARLEPADAGALQALAGLDSAAGAFASAASWYEKALERRPRNGPLWNALGYARAWAGDLEGATQALSRYRELNPGEANPLDSLGDVQYLFGRFGEAESLYLKAHATNPAFLGGGELHKAAWARLMGGDRKGADELFQRFLAARQAGRDVLAPYRQAEWEFLSGRRKQAISRLEQFAAAAPRAAASLAYAQLSLWSLEAGDRARARGYAQRAPGSSGLLTLCRFLSEPPAPASEWGARADRTFSGPLEPLKRQALAFALLFAGDFAGAAPLLEQLYRDSPPAAPEQPKVLLAWALVETGRFDQAAPLVRLNALPDPVNEHPLLALVFPRIFYLRGALAEKQGRLDAARRDYRLFLQYSGDLPSIFGEEQRARAALGQR